MGQKNEDYAPPFPTDVTTSFHDGPLGRMRSRSVGRPRPGAPEVALVQGMGVADYLMPGLGAFGGWTRAHLVELPGFAGSGDPPHELTVSEFGRAVAGWLTARRLDGVVLIGHSSGSQVAAEAAVGQGGVRGLVLASPTIDPVARGLGRLFLRWRWDGRREPPGLSRSHRPEWKRAGLRRLAHLVRAHLDHTIEEPLARLTIPLLVMRGRDDVISTRGWGQRLATLSPAGEYVEQPGAHTFPWRDPHAWSGPVRRFAASVS
ncbi:Lysophospholipase, alpha-beta hydrolase superfamily [Micromonospora pattaloongensis]|uniref:Lysophospholipase, alpha-beta hydrolase superfamily n=1 Tax=Micromonospora pattaloongensis TaxID=405436 RepID=A0A1H3QU51_9ACTN|nr:alpha/beta hydrolase [Micromonospora pattaloongensis]SDZ17044.1 Lysophospholipase, alpha-beta hydrolase superfamily [Micromonospora pattaloongensis]